MTTRCLVCPGRAPILLRPVAQKAATKKGTHKFAKIKGINFYYFLGLLTKWKIRQMGVIVTVCKVRIVNGVHGMECGAGAKNKIKTTKSKRKTQPPKER